MKEIDFERAALLMDIQAKVATVGVMNTSIAGEAAEELKAINEACKANARERADKIRQEEQVAEAHRLEAVREHDELNSKPRGPVQPAEVQTYIPGQPDPNVRSSRTDGLPDTDPNASHIGSVQEPAPVVDRRV